MWAAAAPLPYYSAYRGSRRKDSISNTKKDGTPSSSVTASHPPLVSGASGSGSDLLEPAVDGPPSPERIRALSKQMKAASTLENKHHGHNNSSSGSFRSHSDRPSWDQALENISLSRRSSGRSIASSMPSRERPDSVQIFGKSIFGRKGKLKRESSIHSSSGSSLNSTDLNLDATSTPKEHGNRTIFGRRKSVKGEGQVDESNVSPKKLLISGPYNFQHVTHTRRDHLPNLQRASRMELVTEFSTLKTVPLSAASRHLKGIQADDLHFTDFSADHADLDDGSISTHAHPDSTAEPQKRFKLDRLSLLPRNMPNGQPGLRRLVKPSRSQENLRVAPPRPPRPARSPLEPLLSQQVGPAPPIPPPRLSSRQSIRYDGFDPLATTTLERPQTSGGFRHPSPFRFGSLSPEPPATSHGFVPRSELEGVSECHFPHAVTTPDDEAWPLAITFDAPLPDVPEEEENYTLARRSRASMISNNSSLRGSQSVPLLRQVAQGQAATENQSNAQASNRPPSSGSDTLGRFDLFAAQRALKAAARADMATAENVRDSWEDDIDYCYEHEAEADCFYEWSRPSFDVSRDDEASPVYGHSSGSTTGMTAMLQDSPNLLSPGPFDLPALSPASQTSVNEAEAVTPTAGAMPVTSNFSLPRTDGGLRVQRMRPDSRASSFKESQGFHLSPTLLIPADYRQQMMMADADFSTREDGEAIFVHEFGPYDGIMRHPNIIMDRASTSTAGTDRSSHSSSSGERHASAASNSTAFSKFTMNSASAEDLGNWSPKSDSVAPAFGRMATSSLEKLIPQRPNETKAPIFRTRRRANTTSLSTPPQSSNQSAMFPPFYPANRI